MPEEAAIIEEKTVMKECLDCLMAIKAKGAVAGPTSCNECHKKK